MPKRSCSPIHPLSTLGLAAGNRLTDYTPVVLSALWTHLPILLVLFLPLILLLIFGTKLFGFAPLPRRFSGLLLAGAVAFHLLGLAVVHLPWQGDLTPRQLYYMDTNLDDQVEQLGLITMLRLDVKHMIVPPAWLWMTISVIWTTWAAAPAAHLPTAPRAPSPRNRRRSPWIPPPT
mgnify:CR=1 FL=1